MLNGMFLPASDILKLRRLKALYEGKEDGH
jgi:hypothetical protein